MGVIAFECILGRRPFEAETLGGLLLAICTRPIAIPSQYGPVPPGFDAWFARACSRDLEQRYGSARDAALELKRVCEATTVNAGQYPALATVPLSTGGVPGQSVAGLAATQLEPTAAKKPRAGAVLALVGVTVLALGGAFFGWAHLKSQPVAGVSASPPVPGVPAVTATVSAAALPSTVVPSATPISSATSAPPPIASEIAPTVKPKAAVRTPTKRAAAPATAQQHPAQSSPSVTPAPAPVEAPARASVNLGI
jgi:hypothetical protein